MWRECSSQGRAGWKDLEMLYYAAVFLLVGLIAGGLNAAGIATLVSQGAWTLLLSGVALLMIHRVAERTNPVSSVIRSTARVQP